MLWGMLEWLDGVLVIDPPFVAGIGDWAVVRRTSVVASRGDGAVG